MPDGDATGAQPGAPGPGTKLQRIGGYKLLARIGQGGMGAVFKARQVSMDRIVALKVLAPALARNQAFVARFVREARSAARLGHANIVQGIDVGQADGYYYFAMEFVDGGTVRDLLRQAGPLDEKRALEITAAVAQALAHAHQHSIVHRDVKPDNIMLTRAGEVKLADLGLARHTGRVDTVTIDGSALGTPYYMAPEQARGLPDIDVRADIYALGASLYHMVTGDLPFNAPTAASIMAKAITEPLPSPREKNPQLSRGLCRLIEHMTAKDRDRRPQTPAELLDEIQAVRQGRLPLRPAARARAAPTAPRTPEAKRARRPRRSNATPSVVAAVIILAFAGGAALLVASRRRSARPPGAPGTFGRGLLSRAAPLAGPGPGTPAPDAVDQAARELLDRVRRAVAGADAFAQRSPAAYLSQLRRYRKVQSDFDPSRGWVPDEARRFLAALPARIAALERTIETRAPMELRKLSSRADSLFRKNQRAQALDEFRRFDPELLTPDVQAKLDDLRGKYEQRAVDEFAAVQAKARTLADAGKLAEAKALLVEGKANNVPKAIALADAAIARLDQQIAQRAADARRATVEAYPKLVRAVLDHLAARRPVEAAEALAAALADPGRAPLHEKLKGLDQLARAAAAVWAKVFDTAKGLEAGERVILGATSGTFVAFEGTLLKLEVRGAILGRDLAKLDASDAAVFVARHTRPPSAELDVQLALFLLGAGEHASARKWLARAKDKGADVAAALDLMARFAPRPCPTCHGKKTVPCATCRGVGMTDVVQRPCQACSGRGWFLCRKCRGKGKVRCSLCRGTGRLTGGVFRCNDCGGTGQVDCSACRGGRVACKKCKGKGITTTGTPCPTCAGKKAVPCATCAGKGHLPPRDLVPPK